MSLRHGNGCDYFIIGDNYIGQYQLGKAEGYGQYRWSNQNFYSGQFVNGMKHGQGTWVKVEGDEKSNFYQGSYF